MRTYRACACIVVGILLAFAPSCAFARFPDDIDPGALMALREAAAATRANALQLVRFSVHVSYDGRPRFEKAEFRMGVAPKALFFSEVAELWDGSRAKIERTWDRHEQWWSHYVFPEGRVLSAGRRAKDNDDFWAPIGDIRESIGMLVPCHRSWGIWDLIEQGEIRSVQVEASSVRATIVDRDGFEFTYTLSTDGTGRVLQFRHREQGSQEWFDEHRSFATLEGIWYPTETHWRIVDQQPIRGHAGRSLPPGEYAFIIRVEDMKLNPDFSDDFKRMRVLADDPEIIFEDEIEPRNTRHPAAMMKRQQREAEETPAWRDKPIINQAPAVPGVPVSALPPRSKQRWYISAALAGVGVCLVLAVILRRRQA